MAMTFEEKKKDLWKDDLWKTDFDEWALTAYDVDYWTRWGYPNYTWELHGKYHVELTGLVLSQFPKDSITTIGVLGCGLGFSVKAYRDRGFIVKGCDVSQYAVDHAIVNGIIRCNIRKTPYENEEFDLVCNSSVFEHIPDYFFDEVVEEINRVCKKYAMFLVTFDSRYDHSDYTHVSFKEGYQRNEAWYRQKFEKHFNIKVVVLYPQTLPGEKWEFLILEKKQINS